MTSLTGFFLQKIIDLFIPEEHFPHSPGRRHKASQDR